MSAKPSFALTRREGFWPLVFCVASLALAVQAQTSEAPSGNGDTSWTSSTQEQSASGNANPTRSHESHVVQSGRVIDKQSTERLGPDGRYVPYLDVEKESVKVDGTTTRTIQRTFVRDSDGRRTLSQVTEEETRTLPGGQKSTLTTSNPDADGRLQVVQKEIQDTRQIGADVKETKTTILTPSSNGGFAPSIQRDELETRRSDSLVEFKKSTSLPDGNGNWVVNEVKEGAIRSDGKNQTREENTLRPDNDGRLAVADRTVTHESETAGNKRQTTESYSTTVPGGFGEGRLSLNQRVSTVQTVSADGKQIRQTQTDARNPGEPADGLRPTQKAIDIIRPGLDGKTEEQHILQSQDPNGSLSVTWVDTRQVTKSPSVEIDTRRPGQAPAPKVEKHSPSEPRR